jgi:thymidylate kinase
LLASFARPWNLDKSSSVTDSYWQTSFIRVMPAEFCRKTYGPSADRMEGRGHEYLEKVRQGFRAEAMRYPEKVVLVDASPDVVTVQRRLHEIVGAFLSKRGLAIGVTE